MISFQTSSFIPKHLTIPKKQTLEPKIFEYPEIKERLEKFCEQFCNISLPEMAKYLRAGEQLEVKLIDPSMKVEQIVEELKNEGEDPLKAAVSLIWLLTAKVAQYDQLYTNGGMRIAQGEKIRDFLKACGGDRVYGRLSTHLNENIGKIGREAATGRSIQADKIQWGLDLREMSLPAKKNTVLFALQPDGSLFIKMERQGCPPFWKKEFRSFANFREFIGHSIHFIMTRVIDTPGMKISRKEHVPKELKKEFQEIMRLLFPPHRSSFFSGLQSLSPEGQKLCKEGTTYGLSKMISILNEKIECLTTEQSEQKEKMIKKLNAHNPQPKGYKGDVKGSEVLIPALGSS